MSKHYSKKRRLKYVFVALACTASFAMTGLAAACAPEEKTEDEKKTSREDTQLLKNGNFEFFNVPDKKDGEPAPEYLINNPTSWTSGGASSYTMSGIIGTSAKAWEKLTAENLAERLDVNNALDSSASDYKENHVDFNGMKSSDLLYKDSYGAIKYGTISSEKDGEDKTKYYIGEGDGKTEIYYDEAKETYYYDAEFKRPVSKDFISNPGAHNIFKEEGKDPYYLNDKGEQQKIYEDENGDYYLAYDEAKKEYSQPVGHVLMLHNYSSSTHNGIAQNYASVDVSLPADTSAEISVWVKTTDLLFSQGQYVNDDQDHGANITVTHTVGSSTLDDFSITSINTEKLIGSKKASDKYNGWVKYTVYINACNFGASTVSLKLGLGDTDNPVEGYAFFDDVTVTKYVDLEDCPSYTTEIANKIEADGAKCDLRSDASEKIFVADTYERTSSDGSVSDKRFSEDFHYLLDLASESGYVPVDFTGAKAKLTADSDGYVSATPTPESLNLKNLTADTEQLKVKLPTDLKSLKGGKGLDTSEDLIALVNAGDKFASADTKYYEKLNEALSTATGLPNADESANKTLVLFSARGAAYTSSFEFAVDGNGYKIVSFWVKTSDMGGSTAATAKITETGNKDNTANFTIDTTNIVTDIDDDNKDVYNGWVQCFFFVHNELENEAKFTVEFSFGNTTINGTSVISYKAGWAALTNMQTLDVKEDVYAYTGSGSYTASLTVTEDEKKTTQVFDEVYGNQMHQIESAIVDPTTYFGTNGASSKVVNNGVVSPYDDKNANDWAGLINKEYFVNADNKYTGYTGQEWYSPLLNSFNVSSTDALANWNEIFGSKSVQPLLIVNKLRQGYVQVKKPNEDNFNNYFIKNDKGVIVPVDPENDKFDEDTTYYTVQDVLNYGFIGDEKTVAANGYTTVSVRVKVSANAIAYVYLVDTSDSANVLGFNAPSYSFWYDEDGNVLKAELDEKATLEQQRANVLYSLRDDGLYEDGEGKLYANTWNYTKLYNKNVTYYTKDGEFTVDELIEGVTYYADEACTKKADHYLVTSAGTKVYEFKDGKYYYIVKGETQKTEINPFNLDYARYDYSEVSEEYKEVITDTHGEWVTVNFVLHAGSESKTYRLELWSGERESTATKGNEAGGTVIFDYSYTTVSSNDLMNEYENEIIRAYQQILADKGLLSGISTSTENISYYKNLVDENVKAGNISEADVNKYEILKHYNAHYYTYSLYDSASFQPFNKEAADEGATGYDYSVNNFEESLAYLRVTDDSNNSITVFTDYSTIDQSIELNLGTDEDDDSDDDTDDNENADTANVWLLASSIVLVVALIFAMIAIFVKDALKKKRRKKAFGKNTYDTNKTNRYIRKLGIKKEEIEEVDAPVENNDEPEQPAEETVEEQPVEETSEEQPVEEVEETFEQPAEEPIETEQPAEPEEPEQNGDGNENGQE